MELTEIIINIENEKKGRNIFPFHALFREVVKESGLETKEVRRQLNILYKQGKIKVGETINDKYITLTAK
jgi:DNA-directed RNA polymerase delta subunit